MIRLPLFNRLDVEEYGMYPGTLEEPGLHVDFQPGLTLILGANGLGKTTLVTILYRMCTGPFEISGLASSPTLGFMKTDPTRLQRWDQRVFASRVTDDAVGATASLRFEIGGSSITVTRSLSNLSVVHLEIDGEELQATDDRFQALVVDLSGVSTFGDWLLLLHYLVFYFEDRRALVWDPTAQRQILRLLLLPKDAASNWAERERGTVELDSRVRNLQNTLNREEGVERRSRTKAKQGREVVAELSTHEAALAEELARRDALSEQLPGAEAARQRARLRALTVEQEQDSTRRALERLQLSRIADAFPSHDETGRYLLGRLFSDETCQACGHHVPEFVAAMQQRIAATECVVCGSLISEAPRRSRGFQAEFSRLTSELERLMTALETARRVRVEAEAIYEASREAFNAADEAVIRRRAVVADLVRRLPPDSRTLHRQSAEVSSLRGRLDRLKAELDVLRANFEELVRHDTGTIVKRRAQIIATFNAFAEGFLFESSRLHWAPHKSRVGQTGPLVYFPAFEFEMGGSDFPSPVRRSGPEQVSESQREFVDLAFRMTLMQVATGTSAGSLIIDAPETSLDAVFSERAATVLVRFADPLANNRVIVTSNLVDGQLIPKMLDEADITSTEDARLVDLLRIATPTTAIREMFTDYKRVRDQLFSGSRKL